MTQSISKFSAGSIGHLSVAFSILDMLQELERCRGDAVVDDPGGFDQLDEIFARAVHYRYLDIVSSIKQLSMPGPRSADRRCSQVESDNAAAH